MKNEQRNHVTRAGADSCKGDSGGPLVCDINGSLTLIGIVSKGKMCNKEGFPGIYTNVQAFRTWLDESKFKRISYRATLLADFPLLIFFFLRKGFHLVRVGFM